MDPSVCEVKANKSNPRWFYIQCVCVTCDDTENREVRGRAGRPLAAVPLCPAKQKASDIKL